jgi:hypothetical protein
VRKLTNFWETLDLLSTAILPAIDWRGGHPSEWQVIAPLLANTGGRSTSVACPSGAGENCPRRIITLSDGRLVAECQDEPPTCDTLDLTTQDILIQRLDLQRFSGMVASALTLNPAGFKKWPDGMFLIGTRDVVAGRSVSVFGLFQGGSQPSKSLSALDPLTQSAQPQLLLVPSPYTLSPDQQRHLKSIGTEVRSFDDALLVDDQDKVYASAVLSALLEQLEAQITQSLQTATGNGLALAFPPGTRWGDVTITFISDEHVNVSHGNAPARKFGPAQLGMMDRRTGNANRQWSFLKMFAVGGGCIPVKAPKGVQGYQKQKQLLSECLQAAFGIAGEPIPVDGRDYRTAFTIRDHRPLTAQQ